MIDSRSVIMEQRDLAKDKRREEQRNEEKLRKCIEKWRRNQASKDKNPKRLEESRNAGRILEENVQNSRLSSSLPLTWSQKTLVEQRGSSDASTQQRSSQVVRINGIPRIPDRERRRERKSSFPLRKHQDNQLGYTGRHHHRHPWQKERQDEYMAYMKGVPYKREDSD